MPKKEQIVSPPTVADLPSDNPRLILVEFIREFVSFAKRINTPGTLAQGRTDSVRGYARRWNDQEGCCGKKYLRMLAVVSTELVAAIACYHKSCYENYTWNIPVNGNKKEDSVYTEYSRAELQGCEKLFNDWDW